MKGWGDLGKITASICLLLGSPAWAQNDVPLNPFFSPSKPAPAPEKAPVAAPRASRKKPERKKPKAVAQKLPPIKDARLRASLPPVTGKVLAVVPLRRDPVRELYAFRNEHRLKVSVGDHLILFRAARPTAEVQIVHVEPKQFLAQTLSHLDGRPHLTLGEALLAQKQLIRQAAVANYKKSAVIDFSSGEAFRASSTSPLGDAVSALKEGVHQSSLESTAAPHSILQAAPEVSRAPLTKPVAAPAPRVTEGVRIAETEGAPSEQDLRDSRLRGTAPRPPPDPLTGLDNFPDVPRASPAPEARRTLPVPMPLRAKEEPRKLSHRQPPVVKNFSDEESLPKAGPKNFQAWAGLGLGFFSYSDPQLPRNLAASSYHAGHLNLMGGAEGDLGERFFLEGRLSFTALALAASPARARELELELGGGKNFPIDSAWTLRLHATYSYRALFGSQSQFGISGLQSPTVYPSLRYELGDGKALEGFLRLSPLLNGFALLSPLKSFEAALGARFDWTPQIFLGLELSHLQVELGSSSESRWTRVLASSGWRF